MPRTPLTLRFFLLFIALALVPWISGCQSKHLPVAGSGVLDLSGENLTKLGPLPIHGEWKMYWRKFINPALQVDQLPGQATLFVMPHSWNDWKQNGSPVGGEGYASFSLEILLPPGTDDIGLWVPNASTAYVLFVDGRKVAESGTPGKNASTTIPHYKIQTAVATVQEDRVHLVLHVANFHHRRGGMWKPLYIGSVSQIQTHNTIETMYDFILLGNFLALGFYNVMLYFSSRKRPLVSLLLGLFFITLGIRVLVMGQMLITQLFPAFPWALQLKIEYLTSHVVPFLIVVIINRLYPGKLDWRISLGIYGFVVLNTLVMAVTPVLLYSKVVFIYLIGLLCGLAAAIIQFIVNFIRGDKSALIMIGVIALIFFVVFGDSVHNWELILSRDFAPFGFIINLLVSRSNIGNSVYLFFSLFTLLVFFIAANMLAISASRKALVVQEKNLKGPDWERLQSEFKITKREKELLSLVVKGLSNKEIGKALFISEGTVKNHLHNIMGKLNVRNRTELSSKVRFPG